MALADPKATRTTRVVALAVLIALVAAAAVVFGARRLESADPADAAPNVVIVMMDDMRTDDLPWLPVVQRRIYDRGVAYTRFYTPTALCCPSRASLLRGQYPHNTGILSNAPPFGGYAGSRSIESETLATWLDPTYRTGYVGKYFNGYESKNQQFVPPGWNDWQGSLNTYAFLGSRTNDNGEIVDDEGRYNSALFGDQAVDFINESAPGAEPYFLHMSIVAPHHGMPHQDGDRGIKTPHVPPAWQQTYDGPRFADTPAFDEHNVSDKTGPVALMPRLTLRERRQLAMQMAQRRESIRATNGAIRRVLNAIDDSNEADSTYVIFTSDNGMMLGEHRYPGAKDLPYEPTSRLPLAIRGPGFPAGTTNKQIVATMDVAPTILSLAGEEAGVPLDGHSVVPGAGPDDRRRSRAVLLMAEVEDRHPKTDQIRAARAAEPKTSWKYRGVVTKRWKLIRWIEHHSWELYDLRRDPHELTNLSERDRWDAVQARLTDRLDRLWGCAGQACGE